ncbi:hypothetical protein DNFV4_02614 [Nitrospira tepida]|uniref:Uncharacterized protein n=1 Tax=Nitrospira tepida TaxID=2973512 RepID=A0AA86N021_9BACT|nr:hypothetical protein [Nitrospira tepida]CAI4032186.1 hypothetical protein DNFV4_02614 [Nitrospira tepida]
MRQWRHSIGWVGAPMIGVSLALSACPPGLFDEVVDMRALTAEENGKRNLEAIRALQVEQPRAPAATPAPPPVSNALSSTIESQPVPSDVQSDAIPLVPSSIPMQPGGSAQTQVPPIRLWTPSPPTRPSLPDYPVPAYTIPAPVGPDYHGTIRCLPDGLGGQRCQPR